MELEAIHTSKLLDMAAQLNTMQKGFNSFCTCVFEEIDEFDSKFCGEDGESSVEDLDKKIAIRHAFMSLSNKFRLKIKAEVEKLTGTELEITQTDTIYDSVLVGGMSDIVEKIIAIVHEKRKEGV